MARRGRSNLTPIGKIARGVLGEKAWQRAETQAILQRVWREVVGEFVARHSQVIGIKGNQLVVVVDDHSLMNNLQLMAPGILKRVNEETKGRIRPLTKILMRWGEIENKDENTCSNKTEPQLTPEQEKRVEEMVSEIKDPELREISRRLMRKVVSRSGD